MKTLIKNVHILTMDEQFSEIKAGYLVIEEDTIVELAPVSYTHLTLPTILLV